MGFDIPRAGQSGRNRSVSSDLSPHSSLRALLGAFDSFSMSKLVGFGDELSGFLDFVEVGIASQFPGRHRRSRGSARVEGTVHLEGCEPIARSPILDE